MFRQTLLVILFLNQVPVSWAANSANQPVASYNYQNPVNPANAYIAPGTVVAPGVYSNPYYSPYAGVYRTPYGSVPVYTSPYTAPYAYSNLSSSVPTPIGANQFGLTYGNGKLRLWRASSGYYYPWVGGYAYPSYPIFITPPGATAAAPASPPISTIVSDLDDYLDKAKKDGKVSSGDFTSLKRRASDLLSKEKSLAYEQGGLDADQEAEIRRDVDELSGEVARRVQP